MKDKMQYKLEPKYTDGKLVGYILVIYDMTPDELMDKLAFDEQQRDWAALIDFRKQVAGQYGGKIILKKE